jgi:hypothetical protein
MKEEERTMKGIQHKVNKKAKTEEYKRREKGRRKTLNGGRNSKKQKKE